MAAAAAGPFASAASAYLAAGWSPLPLPAGRKAPPPEGFTGSAGVEVTGEQLHEWLSSPAFGSGNVGVRAPRGVVGVDVDDYPGKSGGVTLAGLERDLGPLPATVVSSRRFDTDPNSGIRWFRLPGWALDRDLRGTVGSGIDVIHHRLRYAVAPPSVVVDTDGAVREYRLRHTATGDAVERLPAPAELPVLPEAWAEHLLKQSQGDRDTTTAPPGDAESPWRTAGWPCQAVLTVLADARRQLDGQGRHDAAATTVLRLVRLGVAGHTGVARGLAELRRWFVDGDSVSGNHRFSRFARSSQGAQGLIPMALVTRLTTSPTPSGGAATARRWLDVPVKR